MPEAKKRVSFREFTRFRVYKMVEPFGDDWDQAAMVAATVSNSMRTKGRAARLHEFRPRALRRARVMSDEQQMSVLAAFAAAHNQA